MKCITEPHNAPASSTPAVRAEVLTPALATLGRLRDEAAAAVVEISSKSSGDRVPAGSTRRAVLVAAAGAAAAVVSTSSATAGPPHRGDGGTELLDLIKQWKQHKADVDQLLACERELAQLEREKMPEPPAALRRRKADIRLFRFTAGPRDCETAIGEIYPREAVAVLARRPIMRNRDVGDDRSPTFEMIRERWPLAQARADAIVAAQAEWDAACHALQERLGVVANEEAIDDAYCDLWDVEEQIATFPARSAEQVQAKARFAVECLFDDGWSPERGSSFGLAMLRDFAAG